MELQNFLSLKNILNLTAFVLMAAGMCYLRLWYTLFLFFGVALLLTLVQRKRSYCYYLCPLGSVQDWMKGRETKKPVKKGSFLWIRRVLFLLFWSYLGVVLFVFHESPGLMWSWILRLVIFIMASALIIQEWIGKRSWCSHFCPLGNVLQLLVKRKS
jgi:polyferredoxin